MENHVILNKYFGGSHFGSFAGYEQLIGSHFEKASDMNVDIIKKEFINSMTYKPCNIYNSTDGYGGTCWVAEMVGINETTHYHFRNMCNLIDFYKGKGFKFVEK